jgi:DNA-binding response OmpR family regulator
MEQYAQILLAEDEINLGNLLKEYLEIKGYGVMLVRNGEEAVEKAKTGEYDILILDVMMPKKDGFSAARDIRKNDDRTPIIFLTAKAQKEDKIEGFEAGADDYLTKPFSMEELLLRVKAVLKRLTPVKNKHTIGRLSFDYEMQTLLANGQEFRLSTKEADLLHLLCNHQNNILLREEALMKVWGDDDYFTARSMDVYITKLRKYLKADPQVQIMNVHGKGYKLMVTN